MRGQGAGKEGAGWRGQIHLEHFKLVDRVPLVFSCCGSHLRSMTNIRLCCDAVLDMHMQLRSVLMPFTPFAQTRPFD